MATKIIELPKITATDHEDEMLVYDSKTQSLSRINADDLVASVGHGSVQSDWTEMDGSKPSFIKNKKGLNDAVKEVVLESAGNKTAIQLLDGKIGDSNKGVADNKAQIESMIQGNISAKASVKIHVHGNVDLASGGLLTFDSYTILEGDRVIVTDQSDATENGIYIASASTWVRATDADEQSELQPFTYVYVTEGDHAGRKFQLLNSVAPVVGTDPQLWDAVPIPANEATNTTIDTTFMSIDASNVEEAVDRLDEAMTGVNNATGTTSNRLSSITGTPNGTLGSFTGTLISDNSNIREALQSLELATESVGEYVNSSKFTSPLDITFPNALWTTITHNLGEQFPSSVQLFDAEDNYTHATHSFRWRPKSGSTTEIEVYQDSGVNRTAKVIIRR